MAKRICTIPDCEDPAVARGWCNKHWKRWKSTGDPLATKYLSVEQRFWAKVDRRGPDECWPWLAARRGGGYGAFSPSAHSDIQYAHRYAYELLVGPIPEGLTLDHLCRVRHCVNPTHLEPVTNRENILRGTGFSARAARATHCPQGHPYDATNTYVRPSGYRDCRACHREEVNRAARRKRQANG